MHRSTLAACAVAVMFALAGCGGVGTGGPTDAPTTTISPPPGTDAPPANSTVQYDSYVFDTAKTPQPVLDDGIVYPDDASGNASYYATLLTDANDTTRFNWDVLSNDTRAFVNGTDFETSSLLVVQAFPKSSVPDYRVESLTRSGDSLHVRINDSSEARTADITLETALIRVHHEGSPPTSATVTTQTGLTFETGSGPTTVPPPEDDGGSMYDVTLPYASDNASQNVEDPRGITIRNTGNETNGYNVTVVGVVEPACRDSTPPCMAPAREIVIAQEIGKLQPGDSTTFEDLVAKKGTYDVTVEADLPQGENGRRTVTETVEWQIDDDHGDLAVTISDEDVRVTQQPN